MLRFLFILILLYFVFRFFAKYIFPALLGNYVNKKISEMQQHQQSHQNYNQHREGDVTIETKTNNKKKYSKDSGEYIDYEEVK